MCITCIKERCYNQETDSIDFSTFKDILRTIDKPYIEKVVNNSVKRYNDTFEGKPVESGNKMKIIGYYFSSIQALPQYKFLDWKQGVDLNIKLQSVSTDGIVQICEEKYDPQINAHQDETYYLPLDSEFVVTQEMINLFGQGYKKTDYKAMWDKYQFLKKGYPDITTLHTEALVTYVRFKVREEQAVLSGMVAEAEKWSNAARNAADRAKINPSQLSQSDLQGGINSFSELFMSIEQVVDVIPILPQFKYRPNDAIDFIIWCLINYLRDLEGKQLCSYEDVYKFYDKRKSDYITQYGDPYGIFTDDPTETNRDSVKKFIMLPKDQDDDDGT